MRRGRRKGCTQTRRRRSWAGGGVLGRAGTARELVPIPLMMGAAAGRAHSSMVQCESPACAPPALAPGDGAPKTNWLRAGSPRPLPAGGAPNRKAASPPPPRPKLKDGPAGAPGGVKAALPKGFGWLDTDGATIAVPSGAMVAAPKSSCSMLISCCTASALSCTEGRRSMTHLTLSTSFHPRSFIKYAITMAGDRVMPDMQWTRILAPSERASSMKSMHSCSGGGIAEAVW
mmetsp:Transcript_27804/g.71578  ORF Transcript_27804/g.71578 Transcript_27804/m.71578 type:complete len:231 (-) Transcript_27804:575-1267(-)